MTVHRLAFLLAAMLLVGGTLLLLSRRPDRRLGVLVIAGGCALLAFDAVLDGALTAIAVSP